MNKYILITYVLLIGNLHLLAQENKEETIQIDDNEYVLFYPSHELESKIKNGLRVRYKLIKLKTHPELNLDSVEYKSYSKLLDTIQTLNNVTFKDSASIILKNGISWNLNETPPSTPKNFHIKAMTKKGRKDKAVVDRLKYLQFCHRWREIDELPREMVEKFVVYQRIEIDKVLYFESLYEIKFNTDKGTNFSKKEIEINSDLLMHNR